MYFPQYIYLGNEVAGLVQRVEAGSRDIKVGQPDDQPTKRALKGWPSAMPNPINRGPPVRSASLPHGIIKGRSGLFDVAWRAGVEGECYIGRAKQEQKKVISIWESWRSMKLMMGGEYSCCSCDCIFVCSCARNDIT